MARLKTGSIVADITGKVGDNIYSRNAGGPYVKAFAAPTIPITPFVTSARTALTQANTAWATLSDFEAQGWENFSKQYLRSSFYDGYRPIEGRALFISSYINLYFAGVSPSPLLVAPTSPGFQKFEIDLSASPSPLLQIIGGAASANHRVIWYASSPQPATVRSINSIPLYAFGSTPYNPGTPYDFSSDYLTRFGVLPLAPSARLFVKARVIDLFSGLEVGSFSSNAVFLGVETPFIEGVTASNPGVYTTHNVSLSFVAAYDGLINSISFLGGATSGVCDLGVYSNVAGDPAALLASSGPFSVSNSLVLYTKLLLIPLGISAGSTYWLSVFKNQTMLNSRLDFGGASKSSAGSYGFCPASFGATFNRSWLLTIYCNGIYYI